jgi:hypothetical protein
LISSRNMADRFLCSGSSMLTAAAEGFVCQATVQRRIEVPLWHPASVMLHGFTG